MSYNTKCRKKKLQRKALTWYLRISYPKVMKSVPEYANIKRIVDFRLRRNTPDYEDSMLRRKQNKT